MKSVSYSTHIMLNVFHFKKKQDPWNPVTKNWKDQES